MHPRSILFIYISVFTGAGLNAQFTDASVLLGPPIVQGPTELGKSISFHDIDRNGWDDLSIARGNIAPLFLFNNGGVLTQAPIVIPNQPAANINMLLWGDIDNDGDADLLITKSNAPIQLWRNEGGWQFVNIAASAGLEQSNFLYEGAAFCDYDHDGFLDLYVSKFYSSIINPELAYRGMLYHNSGDGTFLNVTEDAGVLIPTAPIFQPVFLDYDNDGWEDLFLVVDRTFHQNELFHNNGDGTFSSVTQSSGMGIMIDAMTGTVGDPDHDADLDVFITNDPPEGHAFMLNNGDGTFTDVALQAGLDLAQVGWGSQWLDYDNDSWEDLFVSVTSPVLPPIGNQFYINQQNGEFIASNAIVGLDGDMTQTYVCAIGDVNGDGYYDLITNNNPPFSTRLYLNNGGENHWLSVSLEGTLSNRDGIGVWMHCYAAGEHYVRFTLSGSDLMNQNSSRTIFGLGSIDQVDSLVILWNSGTHEVYHNLDVDQQIHFVEGASLVPDTVWITNSGTPYLCLGDTIVLDAGDYEGFEWNTGNVGRYQLVTDPGLYQVTVTTVFNSQIDSEPLFIEAAPELLVDVFIEPVSCYGLSDGMISVEFSNAPVGSIIWNTGDQGMTELTELATGAYSYEAVDSYGCTDFGGGFIPEPYPLIAETITYPVLCNGDPSGSATIEPFGGTPPYLFNWNGLDPDALVAGPYSVEMLDANGCALEIDFAIIEPPPLELEVLTTAASELGGDGSVSMTVGGGVPDYSIVWSTGQVDVLTVIGLDPGDYSVTVTDENGCVVDQQFTIGIVTAINGPRAIPLVLFPDPAYTELYVKGCSYPILDLTIIDLFGKVHRSIRGHHCGTPLSLRDIAAAHYVLVVTEGSRTVILPFVILGQ